MVSQKNPVLKLSCKRPEGQSYRRVLLVKVAVAAKFSSTMPPSQQSLQLQDCVST